MGNRRKIAGAVGLFVVATGFGAWICLGPKGPRGGDAAGADAARAARRAMFVPSDAGRIRWGEMGGRPQVAYEVKVNYPARSFIVELSDHMQSRGWQQVGLDEEAGPSLFVPPAVPSWGEFTDTTGKSPRTVRQWLGEWCNRHGDHVWYGLRYSWPQAAAVWPSSLCVTGVYAPEEIVGKMLVEQRAWLAGMGDSVGGGGTVLGPPSDAGGTVLAPLPDAGGSVDLGDLRTSGTLLIPEEAKGVTWGLLNGGGEVLYRVSAVYPAKDFIARVSSHMEQGGWRRVAVEDMVNPGMSLTWRTSEWIGYEDVRSGLVEEVRAWSAQWTNSAGDGVWYDLVYRGPEGSLGELSQLLVTAVYMPKERVRLLAEYQKEDRARIQKNPAEVLPGREGIMDEETFRKMLKSGEITIEMPDGTILSGETPRPGLGS